MPIFRKSSDDHIVRRVLAGRGEEYAELVSRYLPIVHAVAYAQMGNHADADDVAQDAFLKAYQSLDTLRECNKFGPWLLTITRNTCTRYLRVRLRHTGHGYALADIPAVYPPDVARAELHELLLRQLMLLEEGAREVLLLHYFAGKRTPEIAELLGISVEAVKKRLQRAREALSAQLGDELRDLLAPPGGVQERIRRVMSVVTLATPTWLSVGSGATAGLGGAGAAFGGFWTATKALAAGLAALAVIGGSLAWWYETSGDPHVGGRHVEAGTVPSHRDTKALSARDNDECDAIARTAVETPTKPATAEDLAKTSQALSGSGVLYGRLTGPDGAMVEGAQIVAYRRPAAITDAYASHTPDYQDEVKTNEAGEFRFEDLPWGQYRLLAFKDSLFGIRSVKLAEDAPLRYTEMDIEPAGYIRGRVVDASQAPIPGARVCPYERRKDGREFSPAWGTFLSVTTDNDGAFVLGPLFRDDWKVFVSAFGYAAAMTRYVPMDTSDLAVELAAGRSLRVLTIDELGRAVPDVRLRIEQEGTPRNRCSLVSGADGRFECGCMGPGTYRILAEDGQSWVNQGVVPALVLTPGSEPVEVSVTVTEGGRVSGTVREAESNQGIEGVRIQANISERTPLTPEQRQLQPDRIARTDAQGKYQIVGLPAGEYDLVATSDEGFLAADGRSTQRVYVHNRELKTDLDFALIAGLAVTGVVRDTEGKPVENAMVFGNSLDNEPVQGRSDANGVFSLKGLRPTTWFAVSARTPEHRSPTYGPIALSEKGLQGVELVLQESCSVAGRVVDSQGHGAEGELVACITPLRTQGTAQPVLNITGPAGAFVFNDLLPGTYSFTTDTTGLPGSLADRQQVTLVAGRHVTDMILCHSSPGTFTLSGRVVDSKALPVQGVVLTAEGDSSHVVRTSDRGEFFIAGLQEGPYRLIANHSRFTATEPVEVYAGTQGIELMLEGVGAVEGRVTASDTGLPLADFEVAAVPGTLYLDNTDAHASFTRFHDPNGRFRLERIGTGGATILARAHGYATVAMPVSGIRPGATVSNVSLVLHKGFEVKGTVMDSAGRPIAGARVFTGPGVSDGESGRTPLAATDANGSFLLEGLSSTVGAVFAYATGFAPASAGVFPSQDSQEVRIVLSSGGTLQGVVTANGAPVPGARVTVEYDSPGSDTGIAAPSAVTGADGRYELVGLMPGRATAVAAFSDDTGLRSQSRPVQLAEGSMASTDFDFVQGDSALEGTLKIRGKAPLLSQLTLTVTTRDGTALQYYLTFRGTDVFRMEGIESGQAILTVNATGESTVFCKEANLDIPVGQTARLDIEMTAQDLADPHSGGQ